MNKVIHISSIGVLSKGSTNLSTHHIQRSVADRGPVDDSYGLQKLASDAMCLPVTRHSESIFRICATLGNVRPWHEHMRRTAQGHGQAFRSASVGSIRDWVGIRAITRMHSTSQPRPGS